MKLYQINLTCFHLKEMESFYTDVLEMELVSRTDSSFAVLAGTTKLLFKKIEDVPFYHLCFRTNREYQDETLERLDRKGLLLSNKEGYKSTYWQGKQVYFTDPDGNILEMVEPKGVTYQERPIGLYDVCEIGMPVSNIKELQYNLSSHIEDKVKGNDDDFSFFGDQDGAFVLVKEGRHWFPTNRESEIHPIEVFVSGSKDIRFTVPDYPYHFIVRKEWEGSIPSVQFRMARPTNQLDKIVEFYQSGVGLEKVGEFYNHEGYDGVMFGLPGYEYHLEFTQSDEKPKLPPPTKEHLLVFYLPNRFERDKIVNRLKEMGYRQQQSENPYWDRGGVTIEDPDGYRIVLMNTSGIY